MKSSKNFLKVADWALWTLLGLLPLLLFFGQCLAVSGVTSEFEAPTLDSCVSMLVGDLSSNVVDTLLSSIFVSDGAFAFLKNTSFFTYFAMVQILHFVVDFALFLPRLAQRLLDKGLNEV